MLHGQILELVLSSGCKGKTFSRQALWGVILHPDFSCKYQEKEFEKSSTSGLHDKQLPWKKAQNNSVIPWIMIVSTLQLASREQ